MKRSLILFVALCCMVSTLPTVHASSTTDSITLSENEYTDFKDNADDTVIKLYWKMCMPLFAESMTISDITSEVERAVYMVISQSGNISYKQYYDGVVRKISSGGVPDWSEFSKYAINPSLVFGPLVTVMNIYCLSGEQSHDGVYIYFETSKGDYVLYKEYLSADKEYLFPVKDFYPFAKSVATYRKENSDLLGAGAGISELYDLSPYAFTAQNPVTFVIAAASIVVIVAAGVIILFITRKHRKVK